MVKANSFDVDLNQISLPIQLGGQSLKDYIATQCNKYNIEYSSGKLNQATFTPVITALAGQHSENDIECKGVTKAEFVPVFTTGFSEKRVLAISFSLNGETSKIDLIKVQASMTCIGRKNDSKSAYQATEIPNDIALEINKVSPEFFKQLQQSSSLIIFVEFDFEPRYRYSNSYFSGGTTRGGGTRGLESVSKGLSAYSVIGQGSQTSDNSSKVSEDGTYTLSKISLFGIGAIVVNTNDKKLESEQAKNLVKMMQIRAEQLADIYKLYKPCTYDSLVSDLNEYLKKHELNTKTDIFEHSLLHIASIQEKPTECHFARSELTPQYFFLDLGLSRTSVLEFVNNLNKKFGTGFCEFTPQFNKDNTYAVRVPLSALMKNMAVIQIHIDQILSDERSLLAYRKYARGEKNCFNDFISNLKEITSSEGISIHKTDCFEMVLLKMFGCDEQLTRARFDTLDNDYIGRVLEVHAYFDISEKAAKNVVDQINKEFPSKREVAHFIRSNARIEEKGKVDLCEIVIDMSLLQSKEFLNRFKNKLNELAETEPFFIEQLKVQSGSQSKSSKDYADDLIRVGISCSQSEENKGANTSFAKALLKFSSVLCSPKSTKTQRREASYEVKQSMALLESTQSLEQNSLFKKGNKKEVKQIQKSLGLKF